MLNIQKQFEIETGWHFKSSASPVLEYNLNKYLTVKPTDTQLMEYACRYQKALSYWLMRRLKSTEEKLENAKKKIKILELDSMALKQITEEAQ